VQKADRDPIALTVLALLLTGPRHLYEMHRMITRTHLDFVTGLPRSLYHAAERLLAAGFVVIAETTREGNRPERTIYQLTPAGHDRLRSWVRLLLTTPDANSAMFVPALSFAGCLPPAEVTEALTERRSELDRSLAAARSAIATQAGQIPRILMIEVEYEASRLAAESARITPQLDDIAAGRLTWSTDPLTLADIEPLIREDP
jgi:DNA-binding PadR family transcriptional regulator